MANNLDASPADIKGSDISITNDTDFRARLEVLARDIEHIERTAIFKIALRLAEAHEHFVHRRDEGGFQGWVEDRLGYSRAHAYRLLNVASLIKVSQAWDTFGTLPVTAIYQIAAPSTPELAREGILERLKGGERLSCAAVNKIISDAKAAHPAAHGDDRDANHDDGEHHPGEDRAGGGERHDGAHGEENQGASKEEDLRRELPGAADEADAQMSAERRKASNAALEIWDGMTSEQRQLLGEKVLTEFFTTAEGADLHDHIPAARRADVVRSFLGRLGVDGMLEVASPDFKPQLRANQPVNPSAWLVEKDAETIAKMIVEKVGANKAAIIRNHLPDRSVPKLDDNAD